MNKPATDTVFPKIDGFAVDKMIPICEKPQIIFFGNGMLADFALPVLENHFEVVFHARTRDDLEKVKELKRQNPDLHGVLASFGVMIKDDILELFEPEGILNIHPSLLPRHRGASPIETAILGGDREFGVSIMKLAPAMDAGPVYYQETLKDLPLQKEIIYQKLAETGAKWLGTHLSRLPEPRPQQGEPSFTKKFDKSMSFLHPETDTAAELYRKIVAFQGFPKPKFAFYGQNCIILEARLVSEGGVRPNDESQLKQPKLRSRQLEQNSVIDGLFLIGADGEKVQILRLQPEGRKPMDAKSFLNGYRKSS